MTVFGTDQLRYSSSVKEMILNLFFLSNKFNGEWWFGRVYIEVILLSFFVGKFSVSRGGVFRSDVILIVSAFAAMVGFIMPLIFPPQKSGLGHLLRCCLNLCFGSFHLYLGICKLGMMFF